MVLATLGYEGLNIEAFFQILILNDIKTVVDVRELPLSHKPGFSKSSFAAYSSSYNLSYIHISALGCPREIRHDYRSDKDWEKYTSRYLAYLQTKNVEIDLLARRVLTERCCLICFEADPHYCHRQYVAQAIQDLLGANLSITHLVRIEKVPLA